MKIVFCTLHVRRSSQAVSLAAGCLAAALPAALRKTSLLVDGFPEQTDQEILAAILAAKPELVAFPVYVWNRQRIIRLARQLHQQQPADCTWLPAARKQPATRPGWLTQRPGRPWSTARGRRPLPDWSQPWPVACRNRLCRESPSCWHSGPLSGDELLPARPRPCPLTLAHRHAQTGTVRRCPLGGRPRLCLLLRLLFRSPWSCRRPQHDRQRLEEELELFSRAGVSQVWVLDSTFNYPPERGIALLELLLEKAPQLHYHLEAKADFIDRHTASLLGELNCSVQLGLQSIHEQVLKAIHRPLDLDILAEKIHLLAGEGIVYGFDLIYGLPQDNYAGFRDSLDTVLSFAPNHVHIFPLALLPGTRLAQQRDRYGIEAQAEPPYELLSSTNWTVEELELCRRLAATVDLFYNTGRAVAFFPAILQALQTRPSALFEDFFQWALQQPEIDYDSLMVTANWSAADVYRMLQGYLCHQLHRTGQGHLVSVFLDLLCYHFHYAETLLGEELLPPADDQTLRHEPVGDTVATLGQVPPGALCLRNSRPAGNGGHAAGRDRHASSARWARLRSSCGVTTRSSANR